MLTIMQGSVGHVLAQGTVATEHYFEIAAWGHARRKHAWCFGRCVVLQPFLSILQS